MDVYVKTKWKFKGIYGGIQDVIVKMDKLDDKYYWFLYSYDTGNEHIIMDRILSADDNEVLESDFDGSIC